MTTKSEQIQRRLSEAVIDMINEFRLQMAAGPLPDKALDHIVFRPPRNPARTRPSPAPRPRVLARA